MTEVSFDQLQQAFVEERITLEQLVEVLIDNFGAKKTRKIIEKNINLALKQERKRLLEDKNEERTS
jgi:hypothetical protein